MTLPRRRLLKLAAANLALTSLALPALPRLARAQAYPSRPLTMIVPYAAGAPTGTAGIGSPPHIGGVLFQSLTGTALTFVHYRGVSLATQDLVAGQIDMVIADPTTATPQVRAGTIKAYAVAAPTRLPALPDVPTSDEAGLPGFHVATWNALFAPKGTPRAIIERLNAAAVTALADPAVRARF